jgi:hypothetical protein
MNSLVLGTTSCKWSLICVFYVGWWMIDTWGSMYRWDVLITLGLILVPYIAMSLDVASNAINCEGGKDHFALFSCVAHQHVNTNILLYRVFWQYHFITLTLFWQCNFLAVQFFCTDFLWQYNFLDNDHFLHYETYIPFTHTQNCVFGTVQKSVLSYVICAKNGNAKKMFMDPKKLYWLKIARCQKIVLLKKYMQ